MLIHNNVGTRHWNLEREKIQTWNQGIQKKLQASTQNMPLHLVAWRLRLSLADIGLRILPIIFLGKGGRRDSEEWLRYLLVTGKARSRKGVGLKYDLEYLDSFSVLFLLF